MHLNSAILRGREQERQHLAQILHDDLGQHLALLKLKLTEGILSEKRQEELISILDETFNRLRKITFECSPPTLKDFGFLGALEDRLSELQKASGIECRLECESRKLKIKSPFDLTLYRLVQESLNNVVRHSGARAVVVRLNKDKKNLCLEVEDNGRGLTAPPNKYGFGIPSMKERVNLLRGKFSIREVKGGGTRVRVVIPLNRLGLQ